MKRGSGACLATTGMPAWTWRAMRLSKRKNRVGAEPRVRHRLLEAPQQADHPLSAA
jgi:hypothetical protein